MPSFPFLQVDAFTDVPLSGNACAVIFDEGERLDAATMLAVARETNLSETAFVRRPRLPGADFAARYWTPAAEIPLAGHPTIATLFALVETGRLVLRGPGTSVGLELPVGVIRVDVAADARGRVREVAMFQPAPRFGRTFDTAESLAAFGLDPADALPGAPPPQVVSTGTPQLMVPVRDLGALRRARLDVDRYARLNLAAAGDAAFFSAHLFCLTGVTPAGQTFARHFAGPPNNGFEDPFTGSATGGMAAFLWHHGLITDPAFTAEQGHWMDRPGRASVGALGPPDAMTGVRVAGAAVATLRGELFLP